jgi:hypothetical protein
MKFLIKDKSRYILVSDEENPKLSTRHKSHIEKVMFLCPQARPRMVGHEYWDGKIGIFPIGEYYPAVRTTANRPAGTQLFRNTTLDRADYIELLFNKVLPEITEKWPAADWNTRGEIRVQQDGASVHINTDSSTQMRQFRERLHTIGLGGNIELYTQLANFPDTNLNDLGFFRGLQSLYKGRCPNNSIDIIKFVNLTYEAYEATKINRIWLTYQACFNSIIDCEGGNEYKIPHMSKDKVLRETGELPRVLPVTENAEQYLDFFGMRDDEEI